MERGIEMSKTTELTSHKLNEFPDGLQIGFMTNENLRKSRPTQERGLPLVELTFVVSNTTIQAGSASKSTTVNSLSARKKSLTVGTGAMTNKQ